MKVSKTWVCDVCGKRGRWGKGWRYMPGIESEANNGESWVMCSDACEDSACEKWRQIRQ